MRESRRAPPRRLSHGAGQGIGFRAASAKVSPPSISLMMAVNSESMAAMAGSPLGIRRLGDVTRGEALAKFRKPTPNA